MEKVDGVLKSIDFDVDPWMDYVTVLKIKQQEILEKEILLCYIDLSLEKNNDINNNK